MTQAKGTKDYFFAVLKEVPVARQRELRVIPIVWLCSEDAKPQILKEVFDFAWMESSRVSSVTLRKEISAISRFMNFVGAYISQSAFDEEQIEDFILHFIATRITGTVDDENRCRYGSLNWQKVAPQTAQIDLVYILKFFDFCAKRSGEIRVSEKIRLRVKEKPFKKLREIEEKNGRDFLAHLQSARSYWRKLRGEEKTKLPEISSRVDRKPKTYKATPSVEEVSQVIGSTMNPVYKAIFILAAFGGLRISEILNIWSCDVLPGEYRPYFFRDDVQQQGDGCLVLRCHPVHAKYCGEINSFARTRQEFLKAEYGLLPRAKLSSSDHLYAGWKGTIASGEGGTHPVFWISASAADMFEKCCASILRLIRQTEADIRHPYLFINIADRSGKYIGEPVTISGAQKVFAASCMKCGLSDLRKSLSIHSFRHFYKWFAASELSVEPHHIQVMLGHMSMRSQDVYGFRMDEINKEIAAGKRNLIARKPDDG